MTAHTLSGSGRLSITPFFANSRKLRAVIDSVLEGHLGTAQVNRVSEPTLAKLELGCYTIFGGDAADSTAAAWIRSAPAPRELLCPDTDQWRSLLRETFGAALSDRPMQSFSAEGLDPNELRSFCQAPVSFELHRIDTEIASRLDENLEPHALQVFDSAEDFAARGIGFAVTDRDRPVCVASSYSVSHDSIELAISTHPDFRGRGLARVAAATLIVHCLVRDVRPHWNASNPISQRLARSLGYVPDGLCEVFSLDA